MKWIFTPYLALGFVLSQIVGILYECEGSEMFPTHYGSPFVFIKKSLASSMEYFYSISGLILNVLVWSLLLFLIHSFAQKINNKIFLIFYKILIAFMLLVSSLEIIMAIGMNGRGFDENSNYWYWDMDKEAKDWGMTCKGKWVLLAHF